MVDGGAGAAPPAARASTAGRRRRRQERGRRLAPPIEALSPAAAITTGGELSVQGSSAVAGVPATFRPWSSVHAIEAPVLGERDVLGDAGRGQEAIDRGRGRCRRRRRAIESTPILPSVWVPPSTSPARARAAARWRRRRSGARSSPTPGDVQPGLEVGPVGRRGRRPGRMTSEPDVRDHARAEQRRLLVSRRWRSARASCWSPAGHRCRARTCTGSNCCSSTRRPCARRRP